MVIFFGKYSFIFFIKLETQLITLLNKLFIYHYYNQIIYMVDEYIHLGMSLNKYFA